MSFNRLHRLVPIPPAKPENPKNKNLVLKIVFGYDCLNNKVPVDYYWVFMDKLIGFTANPEFKPKELQFQAADGCPTRLTPLTTPIEKPKPEKQPEKSQSPTNNQFHIGVTPINRK